MLLVPGHCLVPRDCPHAQTMLPTSRPPKAALGNQLRLYPQACLQLQGDCNGTSPWDVQVGLHWMHKTDKAVRCAALSRQLVVWCVLQTDLLARSLELARIHCHIGFRLPDICPILCSNRRPQP